METQAKPPENPQEPPGPVYTRSANIYPEKYPFTSQPCFMPLWLMFCFDCGYDPSKAVQRAVPPAYVDSRTLWRKDFVATIKLSVITSGEHVWLGQLDAYTDGVTWQPEGNTFSAVRLSPPNDERFLHARYKLGEWGAADGISYPKKASVQLFFVAPNKPSEDKTFTLGQ